MKLSIIIPTYNCPEMLNATLTSLVHQSLSRDEYEVIVSDDGSVVDNRSVIDQFNGTLDIKYLWQEDCGFRAGEARNKGVEVSSGEILLFLDSGVLLHSECLQKHVDARL